RMARLCEAAFHIFWDGHLKSFGRIKHALQYDHVTLCATKEDIIRFNSELYVYGVMDIKTLTVTKETEDPESQRPSLKRPKQHMLLYAFRELQRAYDEETWETEKALFLERIRTVILPGHKNRQSREAIIQYFERNWFTAFWRG
ncbi:hypothetical protein K435DRAFT_811123, partial [Dendrothele bispora CBS 962.96]